MEDAYSPMLVLKLDIIQEGLFSTDIYNIYKFTTYTSKINLGTICNDAIMLFLVMSRFLFLSSSLFSVVVSVVKK